MMKLVYFLFLGISIALVSFRGGNISYLLFYFALLVPVLALAYSLYVYFRFRIGQEVARTVVKAAEVPYRLTLANEDFIPFLNITLHLYHDMVHMQESDGMVHNICLLPRQQLQVDTKMYCKYRGTYPIGVKSVTVTDFLGLFTITYPMMSQIRLSARPRIIPLEQLKLSLNEPDPKKQLFSLTRRQELPDFDLRQYIPGDQIKYIHWKNSARTGELLVRRQLPQELFETVILPDLSPLETQSRLQAEDNVIEAVLAFVHDYYLKKIPVRVVFMEQEIQEFMLDQRTGFEGFYDKCTNMAFQAAKPLEEVFIEYCSGSGNAATYILICVKAQASLMDLAEESRAAGNDIVIIQTGELPL